MIELLYPSKGVYIVNPEGTVAIVTLWTPSHLILSQLSEKDKTHIGIIGRLYGGGLNILLRNLLYNPQIDTIIIYGLELGHGSEFLKNYYNRNIRTDHNTSVKYLNKTTDKIEDIIYDTYIETEHAGKYHIDPYLDYTLFDFVYNGPKVIDINDKQSHVNNITPLVEVLQEYVSIPTNNPQVICPELIPVVENHPSNTVAHQISSNNIFSAWEHLLFKLHRFGVRQELSNGKVRNELLNMKVVINNPNYPINDKTLSHFGITLDEITEYGKSLLSINIPEGQTYSYGNRINGVNNLNNIINELKLPGDRRRCYLTLWNNTNDITTDSGRPCMVSIFFRKINDTLHMTTMFRTHNGALAWLKNALGLHYLFQHVCSITKLTANTMTIISHSISLDPNSISQITPYIQDHIKSVNRINLDPYGYIRITIDDKMLYAVHYDHDNNELDKYSATTYQELQYQLYVNECISDISHAMYIGNQLIKAQLCMKQGIEYVQDKKINDLI